MKPIARGWSYGISTLGLLAGLWGWHDLGHLSLPSPDLELRSLPYPVMVLGARVGSPAQLRFWVQSEPPGRDVAILPIEVPAAPIACPLVRQLRPTQRGVTLVSGLFFLAVNLLVFCPRAGRREIRDFYWATLLYGTAILIGGAYRPPGAIWPAILPSLCWIVCLTLLPFFFVHLTLTYPRRARWADRVRGLFPGLWSAGVLLAAGQITALLAHVRQPDPATWDRFVLAQTVNACAMVALVTWGVVALFRGASRIEISRERRQVRWLQWGFAVGVAPYVFLRTLPRIAGLESPVDPAFDRLFELAIPVAFTGAVARERFLDIDLVIRRSLIYTILAGLMAAVYFAVVFVLGLALRPTWPHAGSAVPAIAAAVAVLLFQPTRVVLGHWVDQALFRLRRDYERELERFAAEVVSATSQAELAVRLHWFLARVLEPRRALVVIQEDGERITAGDAGLPVPVVEEGAPEAVPFSWTLGPGPGGGPTIRAAPQSTGLPEFESGDFPAGWRSEGICVFGTLPRGSHPMGCVFLGEKQSERRYVEEDLRLFEGALSAAAATMERIDLVRHVAEESMARRQLDEVNRLKNDFLSRAAHDLRTPITSIGWSARNLLDGVAGPLELRQREYLEGVRASADQLSRLVTNLVELSRLESAGVCFEPVPVSLAAAVRDAAQAMRPIAEARGVAIQVAVDDRLRPVRGEHGKLVQIAVNLLDNAVRFSPDGGTVEARVEWAGSGRQSLTVSDQGPGVAPEEREFIFERFRQGRPAPSVTSAGGDAAASTSAVSMGGSGLPPCLGVGLYVVRALARLHGGEVTVSDAPGGGARFACVLPESTE